MSDRIKHFFAGGEFGAFGDVFKSFGQSNALLLITTVLLAFLTLTLLPGDAMARKSAKPEGEDAVTAFLVKKTHSSSFLKEKNIDKRLSPASLTKIMTCMIAIESGHLDDVVTIPPVATKVEPTKAGFKPGDRFTLRDLVKAAMVHSCNDAAFAIAVHLGGSLKGFTAKMNARARALGMTHTVFTNPAGYDRGPYAGNHSTARDLMKLTEHAIRYSEFNNITKLNRVVFKELNTGKRYALGTHNKLLNRYPYSVGIKTGYTSKAGPCLIARAIRNGKDMLVVMLHAKTDRWKLASTMFDHGFRSSTHASKPAQAAVSPSKKRAASASAPEQTSVAAARHRAVPPAAVVYARRAKALNALRHKVERQTAEREATKKKSRKNSGDQAGTRQHREDGKQALSLSTVRNTPNG